MGSPRLCAFVAALAALSAPGALAATDFSGETEFPSSGSSKYPDTRNVVPYQPVRQQARPAISALNTGLMCACSLISTCWRSGQTGFSWCARIPHDRHDSPLRSQPLCGAQSWLAPYDGGSTITHYDVEVSEYYKNTYVVYDDSRCLAEPEPEPEPELDSPTKTRWLGIPRWPQRSPPKKEVSEETVVGQLKPASLRAGIRESADIELSFTLDSDPLQLEVEYGYRLVGSWQSTPQVAFTVEDSASPQADGTLLMKDTTPGSCQISFDHGIAKPDWMTKKIGPPSASSTADKVDALTAECRALRSSSSSSSSGGENSPEPARPSPGPSAAAGSSRQFVARVSGLRPDTAYTFRLRARDEAGWGLWAKSGVISTKASAPSMMRLRGFQPHSIDGPRFSPWEPATDWNTVENGPALPATSEPGETGSVLIDEADYKLLVQGEAGLEEAALRDRLADFSVSDLMRVCRTNGADDALMDSCADSADHKVKFLELAVRLSVAGAQR